MNKTTLIVGESWPYTRAKTGLLVATGEVVRTKGPRGATLKNISKLAGVTEPAIFRHFDGIDGLFEALCSVSSMYLNNLIGNAKKSDNSGLARLEDYFMSKMETLAADKEFSAFIAQPEPLFADYPELKKKIAALRAEEAKLVTSALKEAKSKGHLTAATDPEFAAFLYSGLENSIFAEWFKSWTSFNPAKEAAKLWKSFRSLIAKSDAPYARRASLVAVPYGKKTDEVKAVKKAAKPAAKKAKAPAKKAAGKKPAAKKPAAKKPAAKAQAKKAAPSKSKK